MLSRFLRIPRRTAIALGAVFVVLVVAGGSFQYVTTRPQFCRSCHEMGLYYDTWLGSKHAESASCITCHTDPNLVGFMDEKVRGLDELIAHFRGDFRTPLRAIVRVKDSRCTICHSLASAPTDGERIAAHSAHAEAGVLCVDCHSRVVHADTALAEPALATSAQCEACHQDHGRFPLLVGTHAQADCSACHQGGYAEADRQCETCHDPPASGHPGGDAYCILCHTPENWQSAGVDHSRTGFSLLGSHASASCKACHGQPFTRLDQQSCETCHDTPATGHPGASSDCETCHSPSSWASISVDHSQTEFALLGEHGSTACVLCHGDPFTVPAATSCEDCHQPLASHPGRPVNCQQCHSPSGWSPPAIDHSTTGFTLVGMHQQVDCSQCHGQPFTVPRTAECAGCHEPPIADHPGLGEDCETCHSPVGWSRVSIDHAKTTYPLVGAHLTVECRACHGTPFANPESTACQSCHEAPVESHPAAEDCAQCHTPEGWRPATVDHDKTAFPLTGKHVAVTCAQCHGEPFRMLDRTDCEGCHDRPDSHYWFVGACESCHAPAGWASVTVDHQAGGFPLTGKHTALSCATCHGDPFARPADTECQSCHQPPHDHPGGDGPCQQCHSVDGWKPATIDHNATGFALTGRHVQVTCAQCHGDPFGPAPGAACEACHQPPASHAGMPNTCEACHQTGGFVPASFAHARVGEHMPSGEVRLDCAGCHRTGVYTQTDCTGSGCHENNSPGDGD
ncbi:MAG: cytochrome c3 family protein [Anaerolineae bacterium]